MTLCRRRRIGVSNNPHGRSWANGPKRLLARRNRGNRKAPNPSCEGRGLFAICETTQTQNRSRQAARHLPPSRRLLLAWLACLRVLDTAHQRDVSIIAPVMSPVVAPVVNRRAVSLLAGDSGRLQNVAVSERLTILSRPGHGASVAMLAADMLNIVKSSDPTASVIVGNVSPSPIRHQ